MDHILNNSSNLHLQSAILKYGLSQFAFVILEYCIPSDIIKREQHFLDLLFSLAKELRYNFNPQANSRLGATHSEESRAKMSGKVPANAFQSGADNPMFGKVAANAKTIYIYSLDYVPVQTFSSMTAAASFLNTSTVQVHRYVRSGKVFQSTYRISTTILSN